MGALLVTLLQSRNDVSLYPNLSATLQHCWVSHVQPCSQPLLPPAEMLCPEYTKAVSGATAMASTEEGAAFEEEDEAMVVLGQKKKRNASLAPAELNETLGAEAPSLSPPQRTAARSDTSDEGGTEGEPMGHTAPHAGASLGFRSPPAVAAAAAAKSGAEGTLELSRAQLGRMLAADTNKMRRPPSSASPSQLFHQPGKQMESALYRFTLPGAPALTGMTPTSPALASMAVLASTQDRSTANVHMEPQQGAASLRALNWAASVKNPATDNDTGFRGGEPARVRELTSSVDASDDDAADLGPMDCADASQYFFHSEEAYKEIESAVYVAPQTLRVPRDVVSDFYLNQKVALRWRDVSPTKTPGAFGQGAACMGSGGLAPPERSSRFGPAHSRDTCPSDTSSPHSLKQISSMELHFRSRTPNRTHNTLRSEFTDVVGSWSANTGPLHGLGSVRQGDVAQRMLPDEAASFVPLVEEMAVACRRIGAAPHVCWRGVDRVTVLQPDNPLLRPQGGRVDNARGEVEDDAFRAPHLGIASPSHKQVVPSTPFPSSSSLPELYYLGPQQYITAAVWWSRVEAFGLGLQSMGLRPGDFIGIVEDTRWEWLVTCYAAWSVGLVVVVFDGSARTMARVAADTAPDMKAIVCSPAVHRALQRHFEEACAAIIDAQQCAAATMPQTPTTNLSEDDDYDRNDTMDTSKGGVARVTSREILREGKDRDSSLTSTPSRQRKPQQKRPPVPPMFIIVRRAGSERTDTGDLRFSADRASRERGVSSASNKLKSRGEDTGPTSATQRMWWSRLGPRSDTSYGNAAVQHGSAAAVSEDDRTEGKEDEEDEALWWSDVLMHGETKLTAWRQLKSRELRLQQQQQHYQQMRQRHALRKRQLRLDGGSVGVVAAMPMSPPLHLLQEARPPSPLRLVSVQRYASESTASGGDGEFNNTSVLPGRKASASEDGDAAKNRVSRSINAVSITTPTVATADGSTAAPSRSGTNSSSGEVFRTPNLYRASPSDSTKMMESARTATPCFYRNEERASGRGSSRGHAATAPLTGTVPAGGTTGTLTMVRTRWDERQLQRPLVPLRPNDLALIVYTAGDPKGVMLTHGALKVSMAAFHEYLDSTDIDADEVVRRAGPTESTLSPSSGSFAPAGDSGGRSDQGPANRPWRNTTASMPALRSRTAPAGRPSYLAYLPLHDVCELVAESTCLIRGLLVCYGARRTLFDTWARPHGDLAEYKPTILPVFPATIARLRRTVESMVSTGYGQLLFEAAYEARRQALRRGLQTPFLLSSIFAPSREMLGGRCRLLLIRSGAGAALHPRDQEFVEMVCGAAVVQSYGTAETAGCGLMQAYCAAQLDSLGAPLGPVQVKTRDVPTAASLRAAQRMGTPLVNCCVDASGAAWRHLSSRPTGELLLRGPSIMVGYYRQPERTAAVLERGGWLHTEDLVERCPDGTYRRVASLRPHHAVTSNGHCIALEPLEALYACHPLCESGGVCVLVHPYRRYICALVLTSEALLRDFLKATSVSSSAVGLAGPRMSSSAPTAPPSPTWSLASAPVSPHSPHRPPSSSLVATARGGTWWPQCLGDPALNSLAAASLAAWATEHGDAAPHERVRHVRVLFDVWNMAHQTRTQTGRLFRPGIHHRYRGIISELFMDED